MFELLHATPSSGSPLVLWVLPSLKVPVAMNCTVWPIAVSVTEPGAIASDTRTGLTLIEKLVFGLKASFVLSGPPL